MQYNTSMHSVNMTYLMLVATGLLLTASAFGPSTTEKELDRYQDYEFDLETADLTPDVRALTDLCLVLLNTNEFIYIY